MKQENIFIRLTELPDTVKAVTIQTFEGYNIYLNTKYNCETQKEACKHELSHIYNNHFHDDSPVLVLENEAEYSK